MTKKHLKSYNLNEFIDGHINKAVENAENKRAKGELEKPSLSNFFSIQKINLAREYISFPIPPHRVDFFEILYIEKGIADRKIDLLNFQLKDNGIAITCPNQIVSDNLLTEKVNGYHLFFDYDYLKRNIPNVLGLHILNPNNISFHHLNSNDDYIIKALLFRLDLLYRQDSIDSNKLLKCYLNILLLEFENLIKRHSPIPEKELQSNTAQLFRINLLKKVTIDKSIAEYANELSITPKHLHKLVSKSFNCSPSQLKIDSILTEAMFLILNSDLTIQQVAENLGFENQSYFSRFFKKHNGFTPTEYRTKIYK